MRILLIAYNYPPLASPQSIRWYYLSRELVRLGAEVHVLAPDLVVCDGAALPLPSGVVVHRSRAGGLSEWISHRRRSRRVAAAGEPTPASGKATLGLNWKGRVYRYLDQIVTLWCFPDSRGQWFGPAQRELGKLLGSVAPDVVISSHEPPAALQLGLTIADRVPVWMIDLGDPVLSVYTSRRWRHKALRVERNACRKAVAISVTTERTRQLLIDRHKIDPSKVWVLTQGFDDTLARSWSSVEPRPGDGGVHLFYAGRFYPFRRPDALLDAVCATPGVRLSIVAPEVPAEYLAVAERSGGRIKFLGERSHADVLQMQQECDVLVNIGNALETQIPGKLYEYLGSGKPILHLSAADDDPVVPMLERWDRGWICANERGPIERLLGQLAGDFSACKAKLAADEGLIGVYGWSRLAAALLARCRAEVGRASAMANDRLYSHGA